MHAETRRCGDMLVYSKAWSRAERRRLEIRRFDVLTRLIQGE